MLNRPPAVLAVIYSLIAVGSTINGQEQEPSSTGQQRVTIVGKNDGQPKNQPPVVRISTGRYLLGIHLTPLSETERQQSGIKHKQVLKIQSVNPGSAAEKSGLKPGDIILSIGKRTLSGHEMLVQAVQAAGEARQSLTLHVLRDGTTLTKNINPTRSSRSIGVGVIQIEGNDLREIEKQLRNLRIFREKRGTGIRLRTSGADVGVAPAATNKRSENLEIQVHKKDNQPARIEVTRNGKRWSVTEKEINKLPKDIRQRIRDALQHGRHEQARGLELKLDKEQQFRLTRPKKDDAGQPKKARVVFRQSPRSLNSLLEKLERLQKQVDTLRREVHELKQKLSTDN